MNEQIAKLKSDVDYHLGKAHEGTALHVILSTLSTMLTPREERSVEVEVVEPPKE